MLFHIEFSDVNVPIGTVVVGVEVVEVLELVGVVLFVPTVVDAELVVVIVATVVFCFARGMVNNIGLDEPPLCPFMLIW